MGTAVILDTIAISPSISLLQAWLSSSIVTHLRMALANRQADFMAYYQGKLGLLVGSQSNHSLAA